MQDAREGEAGLFVFEMGAGRKDEVFTDALCPHLQRAVPATRAKRHTISADTETTDPVFMSGEHADALSFQGVPHVAGPVVVATKQNAAGDGEGDGGDTTQDVVVREGVQFTIRPDVEKSARGIIGSSRKGIAIREELHSIDIRFVAGEGLRRTTTADIP